MSVGIAYSSSGGTFNVVFSDFVDGALPRSYESQANFARSASGTTSLAGSGAQQKRIWTISVMLGKADSLEVDRMFRAWDQDRSMGLPAACGLTDQTFEEDLTTSVLFTTPPSFRWVSPTTYQVDFAVTEV